MAKLIVENSSSKCSECGGNADPHERTHIRGGPGSMWSEDSHLGQRNGCGVVFEEHFSNYYPMQTPEELAERFWYGEDH